MNRPSAAPTADRLLLHGGILLTMDSATDTAHAGDLLVEDGRIAAVGGHLRDQLAPGSYQEIDVSRHYVLPGFVDTHRHCWQNQLRRIMPNGDLALYKELTHIELSPHYAPDDMAVGNLVSALGALDSGVTCLLDWSHNPRTLDHARAAVEGLVECGIRAVHALSPPTIDPRPRPFYRDIFRRVQDEYSRGADQLLTMAVGSFVRNIHEHSSDPRARRSANDLDAAGDLRFARERGVRTTFDGVVGASGTLGTVLLDEAGLLGPDVTFVHCTALDNRAWAAIADSGGTVSLAATSEMQLGIGDAIPAVQDALDHGIRPSLSVDVEVALSGDLFTQMRAVLNVQRSAAHRRAHEGDEDPPRPLTVEEVLEMATIEGARAVGLDDQIGTLAPGKRADIICVRYDDVNTMPGNSPAGTVVLAADPRNVEIVLVGGRVVKWSRELVGVDLRRLWEKVTASRDRVLARGGYDTRRAWGEPRPRRYGHRGG